MEAIIAKTPERCLDPEFGVTTGRTDEGAILPSANDRATGGSSSACNAELRATLRIAQRERDVRRKKRDLLNDAVERAIKLTAVIESKLGELPDLDKAIGEECAALILRSTDFIAEPTLELSPELTRMADRKFSLENQLAVTRQASERLRQELEMVDSDLKDAEHLVESAAVAVAAAEVEPIAAELARVESRACALRSLLLGYGAQRHAGGFLPMSRSAAQLLRSTPKNANMEGAHCPEAAALWRSYLQELIIDNAAALDIGSLS
jgi:hypothetical protein